jgi:hypothetical protein
MSVQVLDTGEIKVEILPPPSNYLLFGRIARLLLAEAEARSGMTLFMSLCCTRACFVT